MGGAKPEPSVHDRAVAARGARGYSAWDIASWHIDEEAGRAELVPIAFETLRFEWRTGRYQSAVQAGSKAERSELGVEHSARRDAWIALSPIEDLPMDGPPLRLPDWLQNRGTRLIAGIAWAGAAIYMARTWLFWAWMSLPVLIVVVKMILVEVFGVSIPSSSLRGAICALRFNRCPDCGQDLTGDRPALSPEETGGVSVGPILCPECASRWPLVPPPKEALTPAIRESVISSGIADGTSGAPVRQTVAGQGGRSVWSPIMKWVLISALGALMILRLFHRFLR